MNWKDKTYRNVTLLTDKQIFKGPMVSSVQSYALRLNVERVTLARFLKDEDISPETITKIDAENYGLLLIPSHNLNACKWVVATKLLISMDGDKNSQDPSLLKWLVPVDSELREELESFGCYWKYDRIPLNVYESTLKSLQRADA